MRPIAGVLPLIILALAARAGGAATLTLSKTDYPTGGAPAVPVAADVNLDGKLDLIIPNYGSGTVSVLLGTGLGTFGPKTDFATGSQAEWVAVGDVNGDGKPDLAVANWGANTISILLGTGTGSFGSKTDYPTASYPNSVKLADMNGDGKLDLVYALWSSGIVAVRLGTGTGSFGSETDVSLGSSSGPEDLQLADLNGDGKLDVVTSDVGYGVIGTTVSVLLGNGTGGFGPKTDFTAGSNPYRVAIGDLNGDGRLDLAVANKTSNTVSVLLGTGTGSFGAKTDFPTGSVPLWVGIGDLDLDGKPDVLVSNFTSNTLSVLTGDGLGGLAPKVDFTTGTGPEAAVIADFDADAKLDVAVTNGPPATVSVFLNGSVESPPPFQRAWGGCGSGNGQFSSPSAMAADSLGDLYVVDTGNSRIQKFAPDGTFLLAFGSYGSGNGQVNWDAQNFNSAKSNTASIAVVSSGSHATLYVLDGGNDRVQRFDENGTYLGQFGGYGSGNGQMNEPAGIVVGENGAQIYVTDAGNDRVEIFDSVGSYVGKFGGYGSGPGQFGDPAGIVVEEEGFQIYALDAANNRVEKFDSAGNFLAQWGTHGSGDGQFNQPAGLAQVGGDVQQIFALDAGNGRIQAFTTSGAFVTKWGSHGPGAGQFSCPGLILDRPCIPPTPDCPGDLYLMDTGNNRVQKFTAGGAYLTQWGGCGSGNGQFSQPAALVQTVVAGQQYTYVLDAGNDRIQQFGPVAATGVSGPTSAPSASQRFPLLAYPNPTMGRTRIAFTTATGGPVKVEVFDASGRRIWESAPAFETAGRHEIEWNGLDAAGGRVAPGIYFYRVHEGDRVMSEKLVRMN